jgi:uncharacterized protein YndB with AHSA1/START domain
MDMTTQNTELTIAREFDAPRELVWRAFTETDALNQWWGPHIFENRVLSLDLRPGGVFHYAMQTPQGEWFGRFLYEEVTPQSRMVYVSSFTDAEANPVRAPWDPTFPLGIRSVLEFEDLGGRTRLTMHSNAVDPTPEEEAAFMKLLPSMNQGWGGTLDQLEQYLASVR